MIDSILILEQKIQYTFENEGFILKALTHRSASKDNYEQFEFLGDSLLNFIITEYLLEKYLYLNEGNLSRMRAMLVNNVVLAEIAQNIQLGKHLILGQGENKSGGYNRESILADTIESIIAAVYLDSHRNFEIVRKLVKNLMANYLEGLTPDKTKDAKSKLQELLQSQQELPPVYKVIEVSTNNNIPKFQASCKISLISQEIKAVGSTKKKAEQFVASTILEMLNSPRKSFVTDTHE